MWQSHASPSRSLPSCKRMRADRTHSTQWLDPASPGGPRSLSASHSSRENRPSHAARKTVRFLLAEHHARASPPPAGRRSWHRCLSWVCGGAQLAAEGRRGSRRAAQTPRPGSTPAGGGEMRRPLHILRAVLRESSPDGGRPPYVPGRAGPL